MRYARLVAALAGLAAVLAVAVVLWRAPWDGGDAGGPPSAAIIDQLSLTQPNPEFVASATDMLEAAGYAVEYVPGEEVTVDFYRDLPSRGYDVVIFRAHSGLVQEEERAGDAFLFTSEPYERDRHVSDQEARRLIVGTPSTDIPDGSAPLADLPRYFGIGPEFIRSGVDGDFDGALLVVMGCNGLSSNTLAQAFVERGARQVTSWDGLVSAQHTDEATERLLGLVFDEGVSLDGAVERVRAELGPDPYYGSELLAYSAGE